MKIAVSAREPSIDSPVDERFGRAACFVIVDAETGEHEALDNTQNLHAAQGAGIQAASIVARSGAKVLLTGHCGPKAFDGLQAAGVQVVTGVEGTVREVVARYQAGDLTGSEAPNVEGHWT